VTKKDSFLPVQKEGSSNCPTRRSSSRISPVHRRILLAVAAAVLSAFGSGRVRGKGGAVVIIGPFPIVFGSDWRYARQLLVLAIVLVVALIVLDLLRVLQW